jgi:hypothetical protein
MREVNDIAMLSASFSDSGVCTFVLKVKINLSTCPRLSVDRLTRT